MQHSWTVSFALTTRMHKQTNSILTLQKPRTKTTYDAADEYHPCSEPYLPINAPGAKCLAVKLSLSDEPQWEII